MHKRRGGGFGPAPLNFQEIRAWRLEMQIDPRPTPWEIDQITLIDDVWLTVQAEQDKARADNSKRG